MANTVDLKSTASAYGFKSRLAHYLVDRNWTISYYRGSPFSIGAVMTFATKVRMAQEVYEKRHGKSPRLTGRNHVKRSLIFHSGGFKLRLHLYSTMYFDGQGQLMIVPTALAKLIARYTEIPAKAFSMELR